MFSFSQTFIADVQERVLEKLAAIADQIKSDLVQPHVPIKARPAAVRIRALRPSEDADFDDVGSLSRRVATPDHGRFVDSPGTLPKNDAPGVIDFVKSYFPENNSLLDIAKVSYPHVGKHGVSYSSAVEDAVNKHMASRFPSVPPKHF